MAAYRILPNGFILRTADGVTIPGDPFNRDYAAYVVWRAHNTPDPLVTTVTPSDVDAYRDSRLASGFVDATTGKTYQCDERSRGYLVGLGSSAGFTMSTAPTTVYPILTADNSIASLTAPVLFALINNRILPWVSATVFYARTLKNQIAAGSPPSDITVGWP